MKDKELMLAVTQHASVETITNILAKNPAAAKSVNKFTKRLALHWACVYSSQLEVVQALVEVFPPAIALLDKEGLTPLHHICSKPPPQQQLEEKKDTEEYLIQVATLFLKQCPQAAQVISNETGCTPLHLACEFKIPKTIVCLLIQAYPEAVILETKNGLTALDLACHKQAQDWASPTDRTTILELLRETQVQVLKQQQIRQEQERQEREEQERVAKEAAEKKRVQDVARQKREDDMRMAKDALEKRQREAQEAARKKRQEEEAAALQKAKEIAAQQQQQAQEKKKRQEEAEQKEREQQQQIRDKAEQKRLAEEVAAVEQEEKKCEEHNPTSVLRRMINNRPALEPEHQVQLKPRVEEPNPGLLFQERRRLKAAEKEAAAAAAARLATKEAGDSPVEEADDFKSGTGSQEARELLLGILHPKSSTSSESSSKENVKERDSPTNIAQKASSESSTKENVKGRDSPTDGVIQNEQAAHKALFEKGRRFSKGGVASFDDSKSHDTTPATVPVTPETTWQRKQPLALLDAPPGFHGYEEEQQIGISVPLTSYQPGIWQDKPASTSSSLEADSCALFPQVNLQSLAEGLGYDRLFDFDQGSSNKVNDPTFQKLQSELLVDSEESTRLREAQQQEWREELKNNAQKTPLHLAVAHKEPCMETIRLLADTWPDFLEKRDEYGRMALHVACEQSCPLEVIEFLVGKSPEAVRAVDQFGNTPLHICCENQSPFDVIQLLTENIQFLSETPSSVSPSSGSLENV